MAPLQFVNIARTMDHRDHRYEADLDLDIVNDQIVSIDTPSRQWTEMRECRKGSRKIAEFPTRGSKLLHKTRGSLWIVALDPVRDIGKVVESFRTESNLHRSA